MQPTEQARLDHLYHLHLQALKLQGKSKKTIEAYSRAVRRVSQHFDCCPDTLNTAQLQRYFSDLVDSHSPAKANDRAGLHTIKDGKESRKDPPRKRDISL